MPKRKSKDIERYTIIKDSREQQGYDLPVNAFCAGVEIKGLKTGDYSIKGYEDQICVERKASSGELWQSFMSARFSRQIERMKAFEFSFLLLEFPRSYIKIFPADSHIPNSVWPKLPKHAAHLLERKIIETQLAGIQVVFTENKYDASYYLRHLFKILYEKVSK